MLTKMNAVMKARRFEDAPETGRLGCLMGPML
jgi:hypothetical protein